MTGVIDLTKLKPETLAKFQRIEYLYKENPDIPLKEHCKRVGLSLGWFFRVRKSLRALKGGDLAAV